MPRHQLIDCVCARSIPTQHPMPPQDPQIAACCYWLVRGVWHLIRVGQALSGPLCRLDRRYIVQLEARQLKVEVQIGQMPKFCRQQALVPAGILSQPVVGYHVGPLLGLVEAVELDAGHLGHSQLTGRHDPAVAGDDAVLAVYQDRVSPAELPNRGADLSDLGIAVGAGVGGVGDQG